MKKTRNGRKRIVKRIVVCFLALLIILSSVNINSLAAESDSEMAVSGETMDTGNACAEYDQQPGVENAGIESEEMAGTNISGETDIISNTEKVGAEDIMQPSIQDISQMMEELPDLEILQTMDSEEEHAVYEQIMKVYEAYAALLPEERAEITNTEIFEELFSYLAERGYEIPDLSELEEQGRAEANPDGIVSGNENQSDENLVESDVKNSDSQEEDLMDAEGEVEEEFGKDEAKLMEIAAFTEPQAVWDGSVALGYAGGTGTSSDPYLISNGSQLAYFAKNVNEGNEYSGTYFKMTNDIVLNDYSNWNQWSKSNSPLNIWPGIGTYDASREYFAGTFDGGNHKIIGLYTLSGGLFAYVNEGRIMNLGIESSFVYGDSYSGGIVKYAVWLIMRNCYNNGIVMGNNNVGGLVGRNYRGKITSCLNKGEISANKDIGGIIGYSNDPAIISECVNRGNIIGSTDVGGIAGRISECNQVDCLVEKCENYGNVTGSDSNVGGIAGYADTTALGWQISYEIHQCSNYGIITGNSYVGGIVGNSHALNEDIYIYNSYNIGDINGNTYVGGICAVSGQSLYVYIITSYNLGMVKGTSGLGGISSKAYGVITKNSYYLNSCGGTIEEGTALSAAQMKEAENYKGFDFDTVWKMGKEYPIFQWQKEQSYEEPEKPEETVASGDCGEDVNWYIDEDGVLTVYGRGYMDDWESPQDVPWYEFASDIKKIVVKDGVMSVGENAFYWCNHTETVSLGNSVIRIGDYAFEACMSLKEIIFPASVGELGRSVFMLSGIEKVTFQGAAPQISSVAFLFVTADVYYNSTLSGWEKTVKENYGGTLTWIDSNLADNEMIEVYAVDLNRDGWFPDTVLPAVPSAKISQYAEELYQWAKLYGYDTVLTKDKCKSIVKDYMPTVVYAESNVVLTEDEYQTWEIMRDIIMLNSMKKSLQSWENAYLKDADAVDLTKTQKKASEILAVYADYTESTKRNPISEALYNIYALDLVKAAGNKTWDITKSYFTSDIDALIEKGDVDSLSQHMFVFNTIWKSDSSVAMGELLGGLGQELKENLVKKVSEEEWNKFTGAIINKNPTLSELKNLKDALSSYKGSFKKFSLLADYAPGILFEIQLLQLGQKLMDTIDDTKAAQYFMIQYYLLHMKPELYDKVVKDDGEIVDYMTWIEQVGTGKVQADGFLQELMGNWYKTGSQSLKNNQKNSLAVLASTTSTIQDMSVRSMQKKMVAYWAQRIQAESAGTSISQIQYTLDADLSFSVLDKEDKTIGTYEGHRYTFTPVGRQSGISTMSLVDESDYIDSDVYVTEDTKNGLVTVAVHSADYQIKLNDPSALVYVEVFEKQGTRRAAAFLNGETDTVYKVTEENITAQKKGGETVAPSAVYGKNDSVIDQDTDHLIIQYNGTDNAAGVKKDVTLPTEGKFGSSVSWESSVPDVVGTDGTVTRRDYDTKVTLTATVSYGGQTKQKTFELLVKGLLVKLSLHSGEDIFAEKEVRDGEKLVISDLESSVPVRYKAAGWYYDPEMNIPYYENQTIDGDIDLYTKLTALPKEDENTNGESQSDPPDKKPDNPGGTGHTDSSGESGDPDNSENTTGSDGADSQDGGNSSLVGSDSGNTLNNGNTASHENSSASDSGKEFAETAQDHEQIRAAQTSDASGLGCYWMIVILSALMIMILSKKNKYFQQ